MGPGSKSETKLEDQIWVRTEFTTPRYCDPKLFHAAERMRKRASDRAEAIRLNGTITGRPSDPLPIDQEIEKLLRRTSAPRLVGELVTNLEDLTTCDTYLSVYLYLERAFTAASMIVGGNRAGQVRKLKAWKAQFEKVLGNIVKLNPANLPQNLNMLFRENPLQNRRQGRACPAFALADSLSDTQRLLEIAAAWIDADLAALAGLGSGRSPNIQLEVFTKEVAVVWRKLTGRPPSWKPGSPFALFVEASWNSGFPGAEEAQSFDRLMRRQAKGRRNGSQVS